jgi:lactate racemase
MRAGLLCGRNRVEVDLPDSVTLMEMKDLAPVKDPVAAVQQVFSNPIGSAPLADIARAKKDCCVVISDITRPVPNKILLPPLLKYLERAGIPKEKIILLIATGMHRPNLGEELDALVGPQIASAYKVANHYCRKPEEYRKIDEIDGAPIEINTHYLDADLKILTGLIEPHFYAGYSGGRKAVLPGISSFETMKFMHSYRMIDHPKVTNCLLDGNPFHEYGLRVTERAGADFLLNVVINRDREIAAVFGGHYHHAHVAGCDLVYRHSAVPVDGLKDLVITSGGGYPLDATFYQISKALICAKNILKPGGTIVVACGCAEGLGSMEFCGIMRSVCSPAEFFEGYCNPDNFVIDQWCAQNIYQVLDYAGKVYIYSPGLSYEEIMQMGAIKIEDVQATVSRLLSSHQEVAVVPEGPYVVGMVKKSGAVG